MSYDHLTGTEVQESLKAADTLLANADLLRLDRIVWVKLDTLRADLRAEDEERRAIAKGQA